MRIQTFVSQFSFISVGVKPFVIYKEQLHPLPQGTLDWELQLGVDSEQPPEFCSRSNALPAVPITTMFPDIEWKQTLWQHICEDDEESASDVSGMKVFDNPHYKILEDKFQRLMSVNDQLLHKVKSGSCSGNMVGPLDPIYEVVISWICNNIVTMTCYTKCKNTNCNMQLLFTMLVSVSLTIMQYVFL